MAARRRGPAKKKTTKKRAPTRNVVRRKNANKRSRGVLRKRSPPKPGRFAPKPRRRQKAHVNLQRARAVSNYWRLVHGRQAYLLHSKGITMSATQVRNDPAFKQLLLDLKSKSRVPGGKKAKALVHLGFRDAGWSNLVGESPTTYSAARAVGILLGLKDLD